jgi:hypothetical protein
MYRIFFNATVFKQPAAGINQRNVSTRNRCSPGAAISLQYITIQGDGSFTQGFTVYDCPE